MNGYSQSFLEHAEAKPAQVKPVQVNNTEANNTEVSNFTITSLPVINIDKGMGVFVAINAIQRSINEMGGIAKTRDTNSSNSKFNYKFRGIEDMYNVISPLMVEHNVVLTPFLEKCKTIKTVSKSGDIAYKTIVVMRYLLISIVDGSSVETCFLGEANDSGDKSSIKAQSAAQKSFYIQTFNIPTSTYNHDFNEHDQSNHWQNNPVNEPVQVYNQQNSQVNAPTQKNTTGYKPSLQFMNEVDEYMRQHKNVLCDVLKRRNLDVMTVTQQELSEIFEGFKVYVADNAKKAKIKQQSTADQNHQAHTPATQTQC